MRKMSESSRLRYALEPVRISTVIEGIDSLVDQLARNYNEPTLQLILQHLQYARIYYPGKNHVVLEASTGLAIVKSLQDYYRKKEPKLYLEG